MDERKTLLLLRFGRSVPRAQYEQRVVGEQAALLLAGITQTFDALACGDEQAHLFVELGHTRTEREELARTLTKSLFHSGVAGFSPTRLQELLPGEEALFGVIHRLLSLEDTHRILAYLCRQLTFRSHEQRDPTIIRRFRYVQLISSTTHPTARPARPAAAAASHHTAYPAGTTSPTQGNAEEREEAYFPFDRRPSSSNHDEAREGQTRAGGAGGSQANEPPPVPTLPRRRWRTRARAGRLRSTRDMRRTGRCDPRPVSEP